jgi:hemoglobin
MSADADDSLYARLGGYDAIAAVCENLLPRLINDPQLGRFWEHRGEDGVLRERQLLIDFLCASAGGPLYYRGRDMLTTHRGMRISQSDWDILISHLKDTAAHFKLPEREADDVLAFVESTRADIVEV